MRRTTRGGLTTALGLLLVASGLTTGATVPVSAAAARPNCHTMKFEPVTKIASAATRPVITQMSTRAFAPGTRRTVTRTVETRTNFRAGATANGEISAKLQNKLIGQGEARLGLELKASGANTKTRSTTVTEYIVNNTSQNADFVFFRGTVQAYGGVKRSYCRADEAGSNYGHVYWHRVGKWRSWTIRSSGAPRCGGGTKNLNSVSRAALRLGCA